MLTVCGTARADEGSDINAALDQRPLSARAVRFLAVTAAGLLPLAAWQTQTLQVSITTCAQVLAAAPQIDVYEEPRQ